MDVKRDASDNRRLAALQEKINSQKAQSSLIKQAFSGNLSNKRIVFDRESKLCERVSKVNLFDGEDESNNEFESLSFKNKRIKSDKEAKLIELQSRFAHDPRFQINESFLDDDNDNRASKSDEAKAYFTSTDYGDGEKASELAPEEEKEKVLEALEEVLGKPLRKEGSDRPKPQSSLIIPRYDPSKPESEKFIIKKIKVQKSHPKKTSEAKNDINPSEKVSKERFYEVNETITRGFESSQGFSFANLFGYKNDDGEDNDQDKVSVIEKKINMQRGSSGEGSAVNEEDESEEEEEEEDDDDDYDDDGDGDESCDDESAVKSHENSVTSSGGDMLGERKKSKRVNLESTPNDQNLAAIPSHDPVTKHGVTETKDKSEVKSKQKSEVTVLNPLLKYEKFFLENNDDRLKKDVFYQPELVKSHSDQWKEKRAQMITALTKKRRHFKHVEKLKTNIDKSDDTKREKKKKYRIFKDTVKKH